MANLFWIAGNVPSSKNSKRWKNGYLIVSALTEKWRLTSRRWWIAQKNEFRAELEGLSKPYFIHMTFIRDSKRIFDYNNASQAITDEMKVTGWIEDDNMTIIVPVFGLYEYDKDNPGVRIKIIKQEPVYIF